MLLIRSSHASHSHRRSTIFFFSSDSSVYMLGCFDLILALLLYVIMQVRLPKIVLLKFLESSQLPFCTLFNNKSITKYDRFNSKLGWLKQFHVQQHLCPPSILQSQLLIDSTSLCTHKIIRQVSQTQCRSSWLNQAYQIFPPYYLALKYVRVSFLDGCCNKLPCPRKNVRLSSG